MKYTSCDDGVPVIDRAFFHAFRSMGATLHPHSTNSDEQRRGNSNSAVLSDRDIVCAGPGG